MIGPCCTVLIGRGAPRAGRCLEFVDQICENANKPRKAIFNDWCAAPSPASLLAPVARHLKAWIGQRGRDERQRTVRRQPECRRRCRGLETDEEYGVLFTQFPPLN